MKITIFGAGAIGGHLGALLARTGVDVSLIARGAHLAAMRDNGLTLVTQEEEIVTRPRVTDAPEQLGVQDYVVLSVKSHQAPGVVDALQPLLGPNTTVVNAMNGIPWWYFYKLAGPWENYQVRNVDPDGRLWHGIGPERAIGCLTYVAAEVIAPGVIKHGGSLRYYMGEPDGSDSARIQILKEMVDTTGITASIRPDIRSDVWIKLMGNVSYNPISALTLGTTGQLVGDPAVEKLLRHVMEETLAVGRALGANPQTSIDQRIAGTRNVGGHKTSMLQDLERGRPLEIAPIVGATAELGDLVGVDTPHIDTVLALIGLRARLGGMLPE